MARARFLPVNPKAGTDCGGPKTGFRGFGYAGAMAAQATTPTRAWDSPCHHRVRTLEAALDFTQQTPARRFGNPAEIAKAIVFLASDEACGCEAGSPWP